MSISPDLLEVVRRRHFNEPIWGGQRLADGGLLLHLELSVVCLDAAGNERWHYNHSEIIKEMIDD